MFHGMLTLAVRGWIWVRDDAPLVVVGFRRTVRGIDEGARLHGVRGMRASLVPLSVFFRSGRSVDRAGRWLTGVPGSCAVPCDPAGPGSLLRMYLSAGVQREALNDDARSARLTSPPTGHVGAEDQKALQTEH